MNPVPVMPWRYTDGGRADAGFKGQTRDCVCRSIAIATDLPYQQVYKDLNQLGRQEGSGRRRTRQSSARTGIHKPAIRRYMADLGWEWVSTMHVGQGCRVHLRPSEIPATGRLVVSLSRHVTAVIDGVIHDTHDPSRGGKRCVYGYWRKAEA